MWSGFFGQRNFYSKCKSALKMINLRIQTIMKKRKAVQKFLKNDIGDLLKSNLDYNAYGRAEGLYMEQNLSSCYIYVQECCELVSGQLKAIHKESECPQECRVAAASLMHAASRFADLLELRDVRTMFTEKYGNELDIYVSKEFVEKLKSNPPTMEMKFQLMKDIAREFSIAWEPTSLEHKLNNPSHQQDQYTRGYKLNRAMSDDVLSKKEARGWEKVIPTPNVNPTIDDNNNKSNQDEVKPRPKSVRSRFIKRSENGEEDTKYNDVKSLKGNGECDQEAMMDRVLRHFSTKPLRKNCTNGTEPCLNKAKDFESEGCAMYRSRSASLYVNHLHPKMPDYDELASRMEALRKT